MSETVTETRYAHEQVPATLLASPSMHTATITTWGQPPKFTKSAVPELHADDIQIRVSGTALHALVRHRGSGKHYSVKSLPHIPGIDGVGTTTDGREVYFHTIDTGTGSFAEVVNVPRKNICELPSGLDKLQVAALLNPVMSSQMAIRKRARNLPENFTVLILGATSMSGKLAITIARLLGAGKVIGCARNEENLASLDLDEAIVLQDDMKCTNFKAAGNIDLVLDYLWGPPALALLSSLSITHLTQWIQIGALAGTEVAMPFSVVRSRNLVLRGAGIGSWTFDEFAEELPSILNNMRHLPHQDLNIVPLSQVELEWAGQHSERTVFVV